MFAAVSVQTPCVPTMQARGFPPSYCNVVYAALWSDRVWLLQNFKEVAARMNQSLANEEECKAAYEADETEKTRHEWEAAQLQQQEVAAIVKQLMNLLKPAEAMCKVQMHFTYSALQMHLFDMLNLSSLSKLC